MATIHRLPPSLTKGSTMRFLTMMIALVAASLCAPLAAQTVTLPRVFDPSGNKASAVGVLLLNGDGTAASGQVQGTGAAAAPATGNPVGVGCVYSATSPTLADGQRGNCQIDTRGHLQSSLYAADGTNAVAVVTTPNDTGANTNMNALHVYSAGRLYNAGATQWVRAPGDTSGAYVVSKGGGSLATGQVSVGTSSTLVAAARTGRGKITLSVGAANTCAFGNPGVTTSTGFPLQPVAGAAITLDIITAIYAACSATTTISFIEQY